MSFADNLKQIRKEHNLSQEEMAELLNVSRQAVSKWEQVFPSQKMLGGKNGPSYALIGVSKNQSVWSGESKILLGWYADKEQIEKEINEIKSSIQKKINTYELKYNVKVEQHGLSIKIVDE